jgi:hypothetical protein
MQIAGHQVIRLLQLIEHRGTKSKETVVSGDLSGIRKNGILAYWSMSVLRLG